MLPRPPVKKWTLTQPKKKCCRNGVINNAEHVAQCCTLIQRILGTFEKNGFGSPHVLVQMLPRPPVKKWTLTQPKKKCCRNGVINNAEHVAQCCTVIQRILGTFEKIWVTPCFGPNVTQASSQKMTQKLVFGV
jgi:hypothetical protein